MQNNIPVITPVVRISWLSFVIYGNFALFYAKTGSLLKYQKRKGLFSAARKMFQLIALLTYSIY